MAKILIIDDEASVRGILRFQLEKSGYLVVEGVDGEQAVKLAHSEQPQLIFLDGLLPKRNGWLACRDLKNDPETKAIPVVVLTSCNQNIDELRSWESGADDYLTKPWDPVQLREITSRLLANPSQKMA